MGVIEIRKDPSPRELAWFGVLLGVFSCLLGGIAAWRFGAPGAGKALAGAGLGLTAVFFLVRPLRMPIYLCWTYLFFPLGWVLSHLLLAAVYYLVLTPLGLLMRLFAGDPLARKMEPGRTSHWTARPKAPEAGRYFRQY
jgi:hypothetical protein